MAGFLCVTEKKSAGGRWPNGPKVAIKEDKKSFLGPFEVKKGQLRVKLPRLLEWCASRGSSHSDWLAARVVPVIQTAGVWPHARVARRAGFIACDARGAHTTTVRVCVAGDVTRIMQVETTVPRDEAMRTLGMYVDPLAPHSLEVYVREVKCMLVTG